MKKLIDKIWEQSILGETRRELEELANEAIHEAVNQERERISMALVDFEDMLSSNLNDLLEAIIFNKLKKIDPNIK